VIIRILGEGQFDVPESEVDGLNELDSALEAAVDDADEATLSASLGALLDRVRGQGTQLPLDSLQPSDLVLPHSAATLAEIKDLISGDGLIPG